jgi:Tol biopolymer transport system component
MSTMRLPFHLAVAVCLLNTAIVCGDSHRSAAQSRLQGSYLGQHPPGDEPEVFAPGFISTSDNEVSSTFAPDGREFYFARFDPSVGYRLMVTTAASGTWSQPEVAPFSGKYSEVDLAVTGDGNWLYYISKRPEQAEMRRSPVYRIWRMPRTTEGWGTPSLLGPSVNSGSRQLFPSLTDEGVLYFGSDRPGGMGGTDLYAAAPGDRDFAQPINLGRAINSPQDETDGFIAPDGSYLLFTAVDRPDGFGSGDLYISFRDSNGEWQEAVNLGPSVNTPSSEFCPAVSRDGRYIFFSSRRRGNDDIYWMSADIIESLRTAATVE